MKDGVSMRTERIKYITAVLLYGTIGAFLRFVNLPSEIAALGRGVVGSLFILCWMAVRRRKPDRAAIRKNLFWLVLSGVFLGLNWIFLFAAYVKTTVAAASLCNYMAPVLVVLAAPLLLREKLNPKKLPCILAAVVGIVLVSGVTESEGGNPVGIALGLTAALCFTGIVLCNRKIRGIEALDKSVVQLAVSALTILPYVILHNLNAELHLDLRSVLIVLLLGAVHTGFAYCLYFSGMGSLPVQTVAILGYLEPVVSVLCSAVFLKEPMTPAGWVGAVLILAAAVVSELIPDPVSEK